MKQERYKMRMVEWLHLNYGVRVGSCSLKSKNEQGIKTTVPLRFKQLLFQRNARLSSNDVLSQTFLTGNQKCDILKMSVFQYLNYFVISHAYLHREVSKSNGQQRVNYNNNSTGRYHT